MRGKITALISLICFTLSGCTVASPWTEVRLQSSWIGIETVKKNISIMFACGIPTNDRPAGSYELRLKTDKALLSNNQTIRISRLRDTLAVGLVGIQRVNGYYISILNEVEAARILAAITESGGVKLESEGWLSIEIGVADADETTLNNFVERCKPLI